MNLNIKFEEHVPMMKVGNADEATTKVNGKLGHFHVLSNEAFTFLYYDVKRGMSAVSRLGFLEKFNGTLVHDFFSMYFNYGDNHAVCNAHLVRVRAAKLFDGQFSNNLMAA